MILNSHEKRLSKIQESTDIILASLKATMPYIDVPTAARILGYTDRGAIKALRRMTSMGFLREHKERTKKNQLMPIFVATLRGRHEMPGTWKEKTWTMRNWRLSNHNHDMLLHPLAADLSKFASDRGYTEHQFVRPNNAKKKRRADFALKIDDVEYQIELELTMKSKKRYESILNHAGWRSHIAPHVWIFTTENHLKRFHRIAYDNDALDNGIFMYWIQEKNTFKWFKTDLAPLFEKHKKTDDSDESEVKGYDVYTVNEYEHNEDLYDQYDVESIVQKAIMKEQKELDKVMRMGILERKKYRDQYLKMNLPERFK